MRNMAVVSERGTITIPEHIRNTVNIIPGDLIEFRPEKDKIILIRLVVKHSDEVFMNENEWDRFDNLIQKQLRKGQYQSYNDLNKAKLHSRSLIRKVKELK